MAVEGSGITWPDEIALITKYVAYHHVLFTVVGTEGCGELTKGNTTTELA